jgi:hypothetical protein
MDGGQHDAFSNARRGYVAGGIKKRMDTENDTGNYTETDADTDADKDEDDEEDGFGRQTRHGKDASSTPNVVASTTTKEGLDRKEARLSSSEKRFLLLLTHINPATRRKHRRERAEAGTTKEEAKLEINIWISSFVPSPIPSLLIHLSPLSIPSIYPPLLSRLCLL